MLRMEVFIFVREISEATALLADIRAEVQTALDLIKGQCSTTAPTIVLLSDALRRIDECAALPSVQALPDQAPYDKQYPPPDLPPCEVFTEDSAEGKADPPPVGMVLQGSSRRFNEALESGKIP